MKPTDYTAIYSAPLARLQHASSKRASENLQEASRMLNEVNRRISEAKRNRDEVERRLSKTEKSKIRRAISRSSKIDLWNETSLNHMVEITQLEEVRDEIMATLFLPSVPSNQAKYQRLLNAFELLRQCNKLWDVTGISGDTHYKSSANQAYTRVEIKVGYRSFGPAHPHYLGLHIPNSNGPDFVIYPEQVVLTNTETDFVVVPIQSVAAQISTSRFQEDGYVPDDAIEVGSTWTYVNVDGSPDRRFANNRRLPVLEYGEIDFKSPTGLHERIQVSDASAAKEFVQAFNDYR